MPPVDPIFVPDAAIVDKSQMTAFSRFCERETGESLPDYLALHAFSVHDFRRFWALFLRWSELLTGGSAEPVCSGDECETAVFFPQLRLSYAENLLCSRSSGDDERPAITACDESGGVERFSRGELRQRVRCLAAALGPLGVGPGDHVVAIARHTTESMVACLASTALGATWSSTAPDLGNAAILSRFQQLEPKLLFAHTRYTYHGVRRPLQDRLHELVAAIPSLQTIVLLDGGDMDHTGTTATIVSLAALEASVAEVAEDAPWPRFPFNHPLFILFSSGTTGAPKCIVHGAGGTLLEHVKEQRLHSDFSPAEKVYFHTSCGWMMWNWLLSALASGSEIVLYDGSVSFPEPDSLLQVLARERVTVFGTSATYIAYLKDAGIVPAERVDWPALKAIQSTGSILFESQFDWVRENVKPLWLQSISGGTDIIGCFVLGNPNLSVNRGDSQCISLGIDIRALTPGGAQREGTGELVCLNPFPSRPIGLYGDPDRSRFHEAYFAQNPGMWTHGDFIDLKARGSARILGRSDGTLNIRGVRIGPAEIYQIVLGIDGVVEAMAVEQTAGNEAGGSRLVLLVVLASGLQLDRPLTLRIKKELSQRGSPSHVPAVIAQVDELPTTHSGKRSERAARDALNGASLVNLGALKNPASIDRLRAHPALQAP